MQNKSVECRWKSRNFHRLKLSFRVWHTPDLMRFDVSGSYQIDLSFHSRRFSRHHRSALVRWIFSFFVQSSWKDILYKVLGYIIYRHSKLMLMSVSRLSRVKIKNSDQTNVYKNIKEDVRSEIFFIESQQLRSEKTHMITGSVWKSSWEEKNIERESEKLVQNSAARKTRLWNDKLPAFEIFKLSRCTAFVASGVCSFSSVRLFRFLTVHILCLGSPTRKLSVETHQKKWLCNCCFSDA